MRSREMYAPALAAVRNIEDFPARFGSESEDRITLQFLYECFRRSWERSQSPATVGESVWQDLLDETAEPDWVFRGVCNLRHFQSEWLEPIEVVPGITIAGRDTAWLRELGVNELILTEMSEDWPSWGSSSHALVAESRQSKSGDNLVLGSDAVVHASAHRLVGALRLSAPGDLRLGPMWLFRPHRFNVGVGGIRVLQSTSADTPGDDFVLSQDVRDRVLEVYDALDHLERHGYGGAPGNLDLALRRFMDVFNHGPARADSRVIDAVTALEAVLGTGDEISFRLSLRVAGLLADGPEQREVLFRRNENLLRTPLQTRTRNAEAGIANRLE